jgi:hypothetical protein
MPNTRRNTRRNRRQNGGSSAVGALANMVGGSSAAGFANHVGGHKFTVTRLYQNQIGINTT